MALSDRLHRFNPDHVKSVLSITHGAALAGPCDSNAKAVDSQITA
jgi:hypothetical protein